MSGDNERIDWGSVRRVLVIRLRSIGDTVLATPTLFALRRHLPHAEIHVLLEDWVAPLLEGSPDVDRVIRTGRRSGSRLRTAAELRRSRYDVVINLHGGTTSGFFTRATGAPNRIGYGYYQYSFLYNTLLDSASGFWGRESTHSAEQQLALAGFAGVPVSDRPPSRLPVTEEALASVAKKTGLDLGDNQILKKDGLPIVLIHPAAATFTKEWPSENFSRVADHLSGAGYHSVAVASASERLVLERFSELAAHPLTIADNLSLPEITALASGSALFAGNDSGIAHIAAAVGTPPLVIFGSSNRGHWRPWTEGPSRIVYKEFSCQPCAGFECKEFGRPRCIFEVTPEEVIAAADELLGE